MSAALRAAEAARLARVLPSQAKHLASHPVRVASSPSRPASSGSPPAQPYSNTIPPPPVFGAAWVSPSERKDGVFGSFAAEYDASRPSYPTALFSDLLALVHDPSLGKRDSPLQLPSDATLPREQAVETHATVDAPAGDARQTLPRCRAVDLGCGTGRGALALAQRGVNVDAVDPDAGMLAALEDSVAATHASSTATVMLGSAAPSASSAADSAAPTGDQTAATEVTPVQAPAEATGLPAGSYDMATCLQAWHWLDADAARSELARLLRPGGVACVAWNDRDLAAPFVADFEALMERYNPHYERVLRQCDQWAPSVQAEPEVLPLVAVGSYRHAMRLANADALVRLALTFSYVRKALSADALAAFADDCHALGVRAAGGDAQAPIDLPLVTRAYFLRRAE